jgi:GNAT superfamily N-acetyltransferase
MKADSTMTIFRPAQETDLAQAYNIFYQNEIISTSTPPAPGNVPSTLRHILRTGTMYVAEQDDHILAFASAITRDHVTFLTDMFVRPDQQSSQLGKTLLQRVLPHNEYIRCTMSSADPRALALYIRYGMQPQWPNFCLRLTGPIRGNLPTTDIEIVEGQANDPEFVRWDAQIGGRSRPIDHTYWVREQSAVPLWFQRQGNTVGYGYIRLGAGTFWYPEACTLGPIGARTPEDATACVLAAVGLAREHANILLIKVPGPHPCLVPLLNLGFHITNLETFVSTASTPFLDARCYISSGYDLF